MTSIENLQKIVQSEFNKIREAINVREQLLFRQLDVICNSNQSYLNKNNIIASTITTIDPIISNNTSSNNTNKICTIHHDLNKNANINSICTNSFGNKQQQQKNDIDNIKFISDTDTILCLIRNFGKFNLENVNVNFTNLLYMNEDEPEHDTTTMVKCLETFTKMTNTSKVTTPRSYTTNRTTICNESEENCGCNNNVDVIDIDQKIDIFTNSYLENNDIDRGCIKIHNDEKILIDFSNNKKFITENLSNVNESVINITLNEAKELIEKSSNALQPIEKDNESNSNGRAKSNTPVSQVKSVVPSTHRSESNVTNITKTTIESKKQKKTLKLKPKITINNCNGIINLKNISSLTINCANKDLMNVNQNESSGSHNGNDQQNVDEIDSIAESQQIYSVTENGEDDDENFDNVEFPTESSNNNSTRNDSNTSSIVTTSTTKDNDNYVNCEFYNRLIAEIKNTLKQQQHQHAKAHANARVQKLNNNLNNDEENGNNNDGDKGNYIDSIHVEELQLSAGESSTTLTTPNDTNSNINKSRNSSGKSKKLLLKNLENLKIILEKTEDDSGGDDEKNGNRKQQGRPVQIEQWLAEIISETEVEPMLNSEILELSKIQSGTLTSTCGKSTASSS